MNEAADVKYSFQRLIGSLRVAICVQALVSQHFREFELVNHEINTESVRLTDFP